MKAILSLFFCLLTVTCLQAKVNIIPQPSQVQETGGLFLLADGQTIGYTSAQLRPAAQYLQEVLTRSTGMKIKVRKGNGTFTLTLDKDMDIQDESYRLDVTRQDVHISAKSYKGVTNAIATIRQLLPPEIESQTQIRGVQWQMPAVSILESLCTTGAA